MKLRKIIKNSLAIALVFGTAVGVAGCSNDDKSKGLKYDLPHIIDKNIEEDDDTVIPEREGVNSYVNGIGFSNNMTVIDSYYANYGVIVVKNSANRVGFYSLFYQKYLIAPQYTQEWLSYSVVPSQYVGHFIKLTYKGETQIYDSLGNLVCQSTKSENLVSVRTESVNGEIYVIVKEDEYSEGIKRKYKLDGTLETVYYIPEPNVSETPKDEGTNDSGLGFGDLYVSQEKIDLKDYGLKGKYLLKSNSMHTVFSSAGDKKIATFVVPAEDYVIIGDKILYQKTQVVGQDSEDYTYEMGENKVLVNTYVVDILTGETKEVKTDKVFGRIVEYKDKKGEYKYGLANIYEIDNKNLVSLPKSVLIDSEGNVLEEVTGYEIEDFIKIGNNYYNETTKIIYNAQMKELAYIGYINPVHNTKYQMFIGEENGKLGAVGYNGKILIPFVYDSLDPLETEGKIDFKDNCIIAKKGNEYFVYNKSNGVEMNLGSNVMSLYEDLYLVVDNASETFKFISQSDQYSAHVGYVDMQTVTSSKMNLSQFFGEYVLSSMMVEKGPFSVPSYFTHAIKKLPNASGFVTLGAEITEREKLGDSYQDAIDLALGENKMHLYGTYGEKSSHLSFTPSKSGKYIFKLEDSSFYRENIRVYDSEGNEVYVVNQTDANRNAFVVEMEEGKQYYIVGKFSSNYYKYSTLTVKENTGEYFDHPLLIEAPYGKINIDFNKSGVDTVFVKFTPVETTNYVVVGTNVEFAVGVSNQNDTTGKTSGVMIAPLTEYVEQTIRVDKSSNVSDEYSLNIVLYNKAKDGSTLLNGVEMNKDTNFISVNEAETRFYEYTGYENAFESLSFTKVSGTPIIRVYNSKYQKIKEFTFNTETYDLYYDFANGEKLYFEIIGGTTMSVNAQIQNIHSYNENIPQSSLSIYKPYEFYKINATTSGIYTFNAGNADLSDPDVKLALYDSELNLISTYTATENQYQMVTENPLEEGKTYYVKAFSDKVSYEQTFDYTLSVGSKKLYSLSSYNTNYFEVAENGTITFDYDNLGYYDSFDEYITINTSNKLEITFNYNVEDFVSYNGGGFEAFEDGSELLRVSGYYGGSGEQTVQIDNNLRFRIYKYTHYSTYSTSVPILTISNIRVKLL